MGECVTVRERVERAAAFFHRQEGVVLTTFNLNAPFLEEQVLPTVLGVEAKTESARRAQTHQRLALTPCTVFYDPGVSPQLSGHYRVVARPVPLQGNFFHPKLIIMAGRCAEGVTWVYLAVSSANLSMSGWGRNAECFGETWIHTKHQQAWGALDAFLEWLQDHAPLGEEATRSDAVARVREALRRMPARKRFQNEASQPWAGTLRARFYTSVTHRAGFADFMQLGRSRAPKELRVYSPYWSEVAEGLASFGAKRNVVVPARRVDGVSLGLSREQAATLSEDVAILKNTEDRGTRFWHMKLYRIVHGKHVYTAVGSCNFTRAGLAGASGNVEAALVYRSNPGWFPEGEPADDADFADEAVPEEEVPTPTPVMIVVAYDWRSRSWRWWLEPGSGQRDFVLHLPGSAPFAIEKGTHQREGEPPGRGATFEVRYRSRGEERRWEGRVVELNLDHSERVFGRALRADEILGSWRGRALSVDSDGEGGGALEGEGEEVQRDVAAAFDAVNLYDLYRAMRALRSKLDGLKSHPERQRALLVGRPDSVMALARLASAEGAVPVVRYLVLRELHAVMRAWAGLLDEALVGRVEALATDARARTRGRLSEELGAESGAADAMLGWFEDRLSELDGGAP